MEAVIKNLPDYKKIASQLKMREVKVTPEEIARLQKEKERLEKERVRLEVIDKISEQSETEVPADLIERERDLIFNSLKQHVAQIIQISFDDYLKKISKTEKELRDSLLPEAKKRIISFLVLEAIAKKENIPVSESELQKEMEIIIKNFPNMQDIDQAQLREYTGNIIRNEKTLKFLENVMSGG